MLSNPPVIVSGKQLTLLLQIESKFLQLVYSILQKTSPGGMYAIYIWHDLKSHFVFVLVHGPIQVLDDGYGWKPSGRRRLVAKVKLSQRVITKVKLVSFFVYGLGVEVLFVFVVACFDTCLAYILFSACSACSAHAKGSCPCGTEHAIEE
jgi:hypothetical protein